MNSYTSSARFERARDYNQRPRGILSPPPFDPSFDQRRCVYRRDEQHNHHRRWPQSGRSRSPPCNMRRSTALPPADHHNRGYPPRSPSPWRLRQQHEQQQPYEQRRSSSWSSRSTERRRSSRKPNNEHAAEPLKTTTTNPPTLDKNGAKNSHPGENGTTAAAPTAPLLPSAPPSPIPSPSSFCPTPAAATASPSIALPLNVPAPTLALPSEAARAIVPHILNFEAWRALPELRKQKLCYHCRATRWQHSLLPVCVRCQSKLKTLKCSHCQEEFLQHTPLIKAEELLSRTVCLPCAQQLDIATQDPRECCHCGCWAAFHGNVCERCKTMCARYGAPLDCERCGRKAAFKREPEKMAKVSNMVLCFECTMQHKKERYYKSNKKRTDVASLAAAAANADNAKKLKEQLDAAKRQIGELEAQLDRKDKETIQMVSQLEQKNFWLTREAEEHKRTAIRLEGQQAAASSKLADLERRKDQLVTQTIEDWQLERDRLFTVIDELKSKAQKAEIDMIAAKERMEAARHSSVETQNSHQAYVKSTEKRMQRMLAKVQKLVARTNDRSKQKTQQVAEMRKALQKANEQLEELRGSSGAPSAEPVKRQRGPRRKKETTSDDEAALKRPKKAAVPKRRGPKKKNLKEEPPVEEQEEAPIDLPDDTLLEAIPDPEQIIIQQSPKAVMEDIPEEQTLIAPSTIVTEVLLPFDLAPPPPVMPAAAAVVVHPLVHPFDFHDSD